jgi:hypothetical protein
MSKTGFLQTAQHVRDNVSRLRCEDPNARNIFGYATNDDSKMIVPSLCLI